MWLCVFAEHDQTNANAQAVGRDLMAVKGGGIQFYELDLPKSSQDVDSCEHVNMFCSNTTALRANLIEGIHLRGVDGTPCVGKGDTYLPLEQFPKLCKHLGTLSHPEVKPRKPLARET